jgi:hypothetical protein
MPYWYIVTRSFRIAWDHKYLWLLALFSGEAGASFNYSQATTSRNNGSPDVSAIQQHVTSWLSSHVGLVVALVVVWLVVGIAFFILAAVCEGATIRGSAEHDAERPFGLGAAWRTGVHLMWPMVRFRLLLLALNLPLLALIAAWIVGLIAAIINNGNAAIVIPLVLTGLLLIPVWFVYGTYLFFLDRLGTRALVLEELKATSAIARAHRLLFKRFGRSLLVWLLSIGVALVVGLALACISALLVAPIVGIVVLTGSGNSAAAVAVAVVLAVIFVPILFVVAGFVAAQGSTYWTLAFRRLDVEYTPA